jgi:cob(I)alamin adenosyltransferase
MKIYTKTGDKGTTSLVGGKRVLKTHPRVEAYGTLDELTSYLGLLRDLEINVSDSEKLLEIQDRLMVCATILASDLDDEELNLPKLKPEDTISLEKEIDKIEKSLKPLTSFILPGGHIAVSHCHIARNICRRAERDILRIPDPGLDIEPIKKYINRLSDYLFVLSRKIAHDKGVDEIIWKPLA